MGCCKSRAFKASPDCVPGLQTQPCPYPVPLPYSVPYYSDPPPFYYLQPPLWDPYNPPQQFNMPVVAKFKEYITSYEPQPPQEAETLCFYQQQNEYQQKHQCYQQSHQQLVVQPQRHSCNCRHATTPPPVVLQIPSHQTHSSSQYRVSPQVVHIQLASAPATRQPELAHELHQTPHSRCLHTSPSPIRPATAAQIVFQHQNQPPTILCQGHMGVTSQVLVLKRQRHVCKKISPVEKQDTDKKAIDSSSGKILNKSGSKSGTLRSNRKPLSYQMYTRSRGSVTEVPSIPSPIYE